MKIYFLRHGIAFEAGDWKGNDYDRPLTGEGRDRMAKEAKAIGKLELDLDAILTSPLVRAKETAVIVGDALKLDVKEDERLGGDFDVTSLESLLQDHPTAKALMLVGHEPSFSAVIGRLIGEARLDLKKGGLACVQVSRASSIAGELLWLVPAKILAG